MKFLRRTLLLPLAILTFATAFTSEEAGCANERVQQITGVTYEAITSISDVEDVREVLQVATSAHCLLRLGDWYKAAVDECAAVGSFSDSAYCQAVAKQEFDRIRLICLQLIDGNPGGENPQPPPPPTEEPPPAPPPSWEPCGGSCTHPFYCDTSTDTCICVSSCDTLCGQIDSCGNQCPYDANQCGQGSGR